MPDQLLLEFRERAEAAVGPVDPGILWEDGRRLRRRRQFGPVIAAALIAAVGVGIAATGNESSKLDPSGTPSGTPSVTQDNYIGNSIGKYVAPGQYVLQDIDRDGKYDISVEIVGQRWVPGDSYAHKSASDAVVSWSMEIYQNFVIDRCNPNARAATMEGAIEQLSTIEGTITQPPTGATMAGLTGTHLQLRIPVHLECPNGFRPNSYNLTAIWPGSRAPSTTVDVWLLEDGEGHLLMLTKGVRGTPSAALMAELNAAVDSLKFQL